MTISGQDVTIYRGDSAVLHVTLTNADGTIYDPAVAVNLMYRLSGSPSDTDEDALVHKEIGDGIAINPTGGIDITLLPADTDIMPRLYAHELKIVDMADVYTAMVGVVHIKPSLHMGEISVPAAAAFALEATAPTVT